MTFCFYEVLFRARELDRIGIARQYLRQAKDRGLVRQVGRGLYVADGSRVTEHHTLVQGEFVMPVAAGILKGNSEKKVWQPGGPSKKGRKL